MSTPWRGTATVYGPAQSQGSKRIGRAGKSGKPILLDNNHTKLRSWRFDLQCAMQQTAPDALVDVATAVHLRVYVSRPKAHYTGRGTLRPSAPQIPPSGKDCDKLARAVGDAMTGVWLRDDARIAEWWIRRLYAEDGRERVEVEAFALETGVLG